MPCLPTVEVRALNESHLRLHRFSRRKTRSLLALLAAVVPLASHAAVTNYVWDGGGRGLPRWSRTSNWAATNTAPPANNVRGLTNTDITFAGSVRTAPLMENSYFIRSLIFATNAASFTLSSLGSQSLTIGSGGLLNYSPNAQTINSSLILSNSQTWNALAGRLVVNGNVNLGTSTLNLIGGNDTSFGGAVSGSGALFKQGAGNLILGGTTANTFSGGVTLAGGTITLAKANALGTGPVAITGGTLNLSNYNLGAGTVTLQGGNIVSASGALTASSYQFQSGTVSASLGGGGLLTKSGGGTVTLTGANLYTGGTLITGGRLTINNLTGSGTGSGAVTIANGGDLTGRGSISGSVFNTAGGSLSPGDPVGQLNIGSGVLAGGSTLRWEIKDAASAAGAGWDILNVAGGLNVTATSANQAFINVVSFTLGDTPGLVSNFDPSQSYLWTILRTGSGITFAPGETELTVFQLMTSGFSNPLNGGTFALALANGGRDLNVSFTPGPTTVPEPSRMAFVTLAACCFIYGRRWSQGLRAQPRTARIRKTAV